MPYLTSAVLGAALCCFAFLGLRARGRTGSLDDYVTARNSQTGTSLGLSFVASGMGAWILFAPPEIGAFIGPVALAGYALGSALPLVVLGLYGPIIRRALPDGRSIAEFAEACYGRGVRRWVTLVSVAYMACFLAAELTAIGAITALLSDVPPGWVIIGVTLTTLLYTVRGGLRASLATDRWQAWLLLADGRNRCNACASARAARAVGATIGARLQRAKRGTHSGHCRYRGQLVSSGVLAAGMGGAR